MLIFIDLVKRSQRFVSYPQDGHTAPVPAGAPVRRDPADLVELFESALSSGHWGNQFRLTALDLGDSKHSGSHGAFEVRCPFHKKSKSTGCVKYVQILGPHVGGSLHGAKFMYLVVQPFRRV